MHTDMKQKKIDTFLNCPEKWSFHNYYCSIQKLTIACKNPCGIKLQFK